MLDAALLWGISRVRLRVLALCMCAIGCHANALAEDGCVRRAVPIEWEEIVPKGTAIVRREARGVTLSLCAAGAHGTDFPVPRTVEEAVLELGESLPVAVMRSIADARFEPYNGLSLLVDGRPEAGTIRGVASTLDRVWRLGEGQPASSLRAEMAAMHLQTKDLVMASALWLRERPIFPDMYFERRSNMLRMEDVAGPFPAFPDCPSEGGWGHALVQIQDTGYVRHMGVLPCKAHRRLYGYLFERGWFVLQASEACSLTAGAPSLFGVELSGIVDLDACAKASPAPFVSRFRMLDSMLYVRANLDPR